MAWGVQCTSISFIHKSGRYLAGSRRPIWFAFNIIELGVSDVNIFAKAPVDTGMEVPTCIWNQHPKEYTPFPYISIRRMDSCVSISRGNGINGIV